MRYHYVFKKQFEWNEGAGAIFLLAHTACTRMGRPFIGLMYVVLNEEVANATQQKGV